MRGKRGFWIFSAAVWIIAVVVAYASEDWLSALLVAIAVPVFATVLAKFIG
jgi:uncharacterized membrane protein